MDKFNELKMPKIIAEEVKNIFLSKRYKRKQSLENFINVYIVE